MVHELRHAAEILAKYSTGISGINSAEAQRVAIERRAYGAQVIAEMQLGIEYDDALRHIGDVFGRNLNIIGLRRLFATEYLDTVWSPP